MCTFSAGTGDELAPELVERVAVQPARARFELRRVDHVRGSDLRHVNLQGGVLADERARRTGVVEVDVREEKVPDVAELEPALAEAGLQVLDAGRRAAVEERGAVVRLDEVTADDPRRRSGGGRSARRSSGERGVEVLDEILGRLDTHGEPDQRLRDSKGRSRPSTRASSGRDARSCSRPLRGSRRAARASCARRGRPPPARPRGGRRPSRRSSASAARRAR